MTDDPIRRPPLPPRPPGQLWWQRTNAARAGRRATRADRAIPRAGGTRCNRPDTPPHHLLVTASDELERISKPCSTTAAGAFGWSMLISTLEGEPVESVGARAAAQEEAQRLPRSGRVPPLYRASIVADPKPDVDDEPVAVIDAWRLLRAAPWRGSCRGGVGLDHILAVGPVRAKTNPFTRPIPFGRTNPFGAPTLPAPDNYAEPGSGGREAVGFVGAAPVQPGGREGRSTAGRRRARHRMRSSPVAGRKCAPRSGDAELADRAADPRRTPRCTATKRGLTMASSTTLRGMAHSSRESSANAVPRAEIVAVRVADSEGLSSRASSCESMRRLVEWIRGDDGASQPVDVLNLSLGYYHETPRDVAFDDTMSVLLADARRARVRRRLLRGK